MEEQWKIFNESVYTAAAHILGFVKGKQRECFNENEINILINRLHEATSQTKAAENLADGKQLVG